MSDDPDPADRTKREGPRKAWMAPTAAADTVPAARREAEPIAMSISAFDPPAQRFSEKGELGRGGMGRVVEAVDRALGRSVAIKQSLATASSDLARFEREVRITARLQHPSVIPILDVGRDPEGRPFYIMRKIEGEPLADRVDAATTIRDRLAVVPSLLGAVDAAAYAHARRIIHRDIKPWNILLGPFGETLLIDWGIARDLGEPIEPTDEVATAETQTALTRLGVAQGTPGFLAPEQARGELVDARADVYSLGATLYYVLTGKVPFGRIEAKRAIELAAGGAAPDFSWIPDGVPRELTAIAVKAMASDPKHRYADAGDMASDLRRFLAGQLVAAHVYTTRERFSRWLLKHRVTATVTALALLAIAVISVIAIRQVIRDRDLAREASALAADRADEMLFERARSLVSVDPTSALAALRELPATSVRWQNAQPIVRAAVRGGIDRQVGKHPTFPTALAFSLDGRRLASASTEVLIHDLDTGVTKSVASTSASSLRWRDDHTLVYLRDGKDPRVGVIDVRTGSLRDLETRQPVQIAVAGGRLYVREHEGRVLAFDQDLVPRTIVETGAIDLATGGARVAVVGATTLSIFAPDRNHTLELGSSSRSWNVRMSLDGSRVAVWGERVLEWVVGEAGPPRAWPLAAEIGFAGSTLYAWTPMTGFSSLEKATATPQWSTRERRAGVLTTHILPFEDGAVLVNDGGGIALANGQGTVTFSHRELSVTRAAVDLEGRRVAFGTSDGNVLVVDMAGVIPKTIELASEMLLVGVLRDRVVLRTTGLDGDRSKSPGAIDFDGLAILDLQSRQVTQLTPRPSATAHYRQGLIVAQDLATKRYSIWDTAGKLHHELDGVAHVRVDAGVVFYLDFDGRIWKRHPARSPTLLAKLDVKVRFDRDDPRPFAVGFDVFDGDPITTVRSAAGDDSRFLRATGGGVEELELGVHGWQALLGRTANGAWFTFDDANGRLFRSLNGKGEPLSLGKLRFAWMSADRVWAVGNEGLTLLDSTGTVLSKLALPDVHRRWFTDRQVLSASVDGVVVLDPTANTRTILRVRGVLGSIMATPDGAQIVAITNVEGHELLAIWTDDVPSDPAALRRFIEAATNARLVSGSSAIRWD